uniref:RING-type domain-containing protein n=1 Tax=Xiphophorus couchianus TaxID=32473 RepID=A0A3B5MJP0_9TELE
MCVTDTALITICLLVTFLFDRIYHHYYFFFFCAFAVKLKRLSSEKVACLLIFFFICVVLIPYLSDRAEGSTTGALSTLRKEFSPSQQHFWSQEKFLSGGTPSTGSSEVTRLRRSGQFRCPICLDILRDPVSIPCGHTYCMVCIRNYWDQADSGQFSCPQCRDIFSPRPVLRRNTVLAEVVDKLILSETVHEPELYLGRASRAWSAWRPSVTSTSCRTARSDLCGGTSWWTRWSGWRRSCAPSTASVWSPWGAAPRRRPSGAATASCARLTGRRRSPQGAHCGENTQPYPPHPHRFDSVTQVLCREGQFGATSYWEVEWRGRGWVDIGVTSLSIGRKGGGRPCLLGRNENSWRLRCTHTSYSAWHDNRKTTVAAPSCSRIGVLLERQKGTLSFYSISDTLPLLCGCFALQRGFKFSCRPRGKRRHRLRIPGSLLRFL